jgi:DNA-binding transcriptional ArsR family regulator
MAEELLERVRREIRERKQAAHAAVEESRRLERALAALGAESRVGSRPAVSASQRSSPRRRRAAPGTNRAAILALVHERPGVTAGEIAQATGIARSTVSPTLSRLADAGAIERSELPGGRVGFRPGRGPAEGAPATENDVAAGSPAIEPAQRAG